MPDATLRALMEKHQLPGLAVRVLRGQESVYAGDFGFANLEHGVLVTPETVFEIASVTKLFTAQLVMRLVQRGQLDLDAPLASIIPAYIPPAWSAVTVRHCLAHQSGIPSYTAPPSYWAITGRDKTHAEVLSLVNQEPLKFEPGERNAYDNTGFYLLGLVIEEIYGQPYAAALENIIFAPLGMKHTRANDYAAVIPHRAQGYQLRDGVLNNKPYYSPSNTFSAGCVVSTADDLMRWRASLFDDSVLDATHRALWWTPHPSRAGNEREWGYTLGLGWFRLDTPLGLLLGHNGGIAGFASAWMYFPDTDLTAVVLCNADSFDAPHTLAFDTIRALGLV